MLRDIAELFFFYPEIVILCAFLLVLVLIFFLPRRKIVNIFSLLLHIVEVALIAGIPAAFIFFITFAACFGVQGEDWRCSAGLVALPILLGAGLISIVRSIYRYIKVSRA
ncbi:MAG: hypothetical protein AAB367_04445 [Patescibacteria group bacterium]